MNSPRGNARHLYINMPDQIIDKSHEIVDVLIIHGLIIYSWFVWSKVVAP